MAYERIQFYGNMGFRLNLVPASQFPPHYHDEFEMLYVLSGTARIIMPHQCITAKRGECIFINRNVLHMYSSSYMDMPTVLCINISPDICRDYEPQFADFQMPDPLIKPAEHPELLHSLIGFARVFYENAFHPLNSTPLLLMSHLTRFCAQILTVTSDNNGPQSVQQTSWENHSLLNEILNYVVKNHARKLTLSEISKVFNMNTCYLSHLFQDNIGMSFQDYLCQIRLDHAIRLLNMNTNISLTNVCYESGFSALKYLNNAFMKAFGCLPGEYHITQRNRISPNRFEEADPADYSFPYIYVNNDEPLRELILANLDELDAELQNLSAASLNCSGTTREEGGIRSAF